MNGYGLWWVFITAIVALNVLAYWWDTWRIWRASRPPKMRAVFFVDETGATRCQMYDARGAVDVDVRVGQ